MLPNQEKCDVVLFVADIVVGVVVIALVVIVVNCGLLSLDVRGVGDRRGHVGIVDVIDGVVIGGGGGDIVQMFYFSCLSS